MKFGSQNKSNMPVMNMFINWNLLFDLKLQICKFGAKTEICFIFYEIWHLQQIENANYNYVLGIDNLDPKSKILANLVPKLKCA